MLLLRGTIDSIGPVMGPILSMVTGAILSMEEHSSSESQCSSNERHNSWPHSTVGSLGYQKTKTVFWLLMFALFPLDALTLE